MRLAEGFWGVASAVMDNIYGRECIEPIREKTYAPLK